MTVRPALLAASAALSLIVLVSASPAARAQDPAAPTAPAAPAARAGRQNRNRAGGAMQESPVSIAFKAVSPTAEETAKFDALETKFKADSRELMQTTTDPRERQPKARDLTTKFKTDTEALLTADQAKQFKDEYALAAIMPRLSTLELTPDEIAKIKPAIKDTALQIEALQSDTTQKPREKAPKLTALADDIKAKIKPLLTADQQTKLETLSLMPARGGRRGGAGGAGAPPPPAAPGAPAGAPVNP